MSGKVGPVGGNNGEAFDDGVSNVVKKVTIAADERSVTYIKIEYIKDENIVTREHGTIRGELNEFSVDDPNDKIVSVGGSYDLIYAYSTTLITSLYFTTSKGFTSQLFGKMTDSEKQIEFKLEDKNGGKLVGFHGRGGFAIDAIGAHFETSSQGEESEKLDPQGGEGGNQWDDGADHEGVTNINIVGSGGGIENIKFDYVKNGETKEGLVHGGSGTKRSLTSMIEINHPTEYIVSVKGWYDSSNTIQGIQFETNTKTSEYFVYPFGGDGTEFSLQVKDKKIVGFHGFSESYLNSIGAYFAPINSTPTPTPTPPPTPLTPAKKLDGVGGDEGALWDDGAFDDIRKIHVGQSEDGVCFVKVEYNKGSETITGDGHGKKTLLDPETFEVEYPGEYITAVGVYYDKVQGEKGHMTLVTSLIFKTNKRTSHPFGLTGGEYFEFKEDAHKIVGFHGKAGDEVHQIGVYVAPITC